MKTVAKISAIFALLFALDGIHAETDVKTCVRGGESFCSAPKTSFVLNETCTASNGVFLTKSKVPFNEETYHLIERNIQASMEYLLEGNVFSEWKENRKGFQKYFHKLSDDAWDNAVALLQHVVIRGGSLGSRTLKINGTNIENKGELAALTRALDTEKDLVQKSLNLMRPAKCSYTQVEGTGQEEEKCTWHGDGEFAHFVAGLVSDKLILSVKHLANHVNTLAQALTSQDAVNRGVILHMYDTQILK